MIKLCIDQESEKRKKIIISIFYNILNEKDKKKKKKYKLFVRKCFREASTKLLPQKILNIFLFFLGTALINLSTATCLQLSTTTVGVLYVTIHAG